MRKRKRGQNVQEKAAVTKQVTVQLRTLHLLQSP